MLKNIAKVARKVSKSAPKAKTTKSARPVAPKAKAQAEQPAKLHPTLDPRKNVLAGQPGVINRADAKGSFLARPSEAMLKEDNIAAMSGARLMQVWNLNAPAAFKAGIVQVAGLEDPKAGGAIVRVAVKTSGWFTKRLGETAVTNLKKAMAGKKGCAKFKLR